MPIGHLRRVVVTAVAVAGMTLAGTTSASADGAVKWRHRTSDDCLVHIVNGAGQPYDVGIDWCGAGITWYEEYNSSDDTWLMHPGTSSDRRGYCLAAYSNLDVYIEPCTPNNDWQRWYERWTGSSFKLQHKQTSLYLDSNDSSVYLGHGGWNNDNKYQLWY